MSRRRRATFAAAVIAVGLTLAGCAADASELDAQMSEQWQTRVLAIAESAEAGDPATALVDLAALETEAAQAREDGEISAERAAIIQQAIVAVRADLEAASVPVAPVPEDTVVTDPVEDDSSTDEQDDNGNNGKKDEKKEEKEDKGNGKGDDD